MVDQEAENVAAQVRHLLTQRGKDAENWKRQSLDWEAQCKAQRAEIEGLERRISSLTLALDAQAQHDQDMRATLENVANYAMFGTETYEDLLSDISAIRGIAVSCLARVSSNEANPEAAQQEETRCPRCGKPLDNLSPGISVIAGGVSVCTSCLNPGETEIARARALVGGGAAREGAA